MKFPPSEVIASWPPANHVNPESRGYTLLISNTVFSVITTIAVLTRLWVRRRMRALWWDDLCITLGLLNSIGAVAATCYGNVRGGWSLHVWDLPSFDIITDGLKASYVAKLLYGFGIGLSRASLILFYYKLMGLKTMPKFRIVLHCALILTFIFLFTFCIVTIFGCTPIDAYWIFPQPTGSYCVNEGAVILATASVNTFIEMVVTLLPIPIIMQLKLGRREKFGAMMLLSIGSTVVIVSGVKIYYVYLALVKTYDLSWWVSPLWICSIAELDVGILCACVPTLSPIFRPFVQKMLSKLGFKAQSYYRTSNRNGGTGARPTYMRSATAQSGTKKSAIGTSDHELAGISTKDDDERNLVFVTREVRLEAHDV